MFKLIERLEREAVPNEIATLVALSTFAVAQPLYSVILREGSFFVGTDLTLPDGLFLIVLFSILVPAVLAGILLLANRAGERVRQWFFWTLTALLLVALFLPPFKEIFLSGKPPVVSLGVQTGFAIIMSVPVFLALLRFEKLRAFMAWLSLCVLIFPVYFLLNYSFLKKEQFEFTPPAVTKDVPVVLIIFDEFPLISLLDDQARIDPVLYPNFAALAMHSTWFFRAFSSHTDTAHAVPAILSGQYPRLNREGDKCLNPPSSSRAYSKNLFSLLSKAYKYNVTEAYTFLCPASLCNPSVFHHSLPDRVGIGKTLAKRYISNVLFKAGTFNTAMDSFKRSRADQAKDIALYHEQDLANLRTFMAGLKNAPPKTIHAMHLLLPHTIWEFYPSGRNYAPWPLMEQEINSCAADPEHEFCKNSVYHQTGYQRHLLQVGYTDKLLGEVIAGLKKEGIYDKALIIVTADHGASFLQGEPMRKVTQKNYADIMSIPLFVKTPGQKTGQREMRIAESVDILPTIADALDIQVPWPMDGRSLLAPPLPPEQEKTQLNICSPEVPLRFSISSMGDARKASRLLKMGLFGSGKPAEKNLFAVGQFPSLMGKTINASKASDNDPVIFLETPKMTAFENIRPDQYLPLHLRGRVENIAAGVDGNVAPLDIAVVINDEIVATTETFQPSNSSVWRMSVLVPEHAFKPGKNTLRFLAVTGSMAQPVLREMTLKSGP